MEERGNERTKFDADEEETIVIGRIHACTTVGGCSLAEKGIQTRASRDEGSRAKRGGSRCSSGPCCKCRLCSSLICVCAPVHETHFGLGLP